MCESTVYFIKDDREELVLEGVDCLESEDGQIRLVNIFGEEKMINARIKALSLVDHRIVLEPL